jgi:STELLO glycosyltransferases
LHILKFIIITSINYPTPALQKFSEIEGWQVVVVADRKTPIDWNLENVKLLTVDEQSALPFETAKLLPWNHYARKNLGYLYAMSQGANLIYETDDDNLPYEFWQESFPIEATFTAEILDSSPKFSNVYSYFCEDKVWPRGFPLTEILTEQNPKTQPIQLSKKNAPIQQGLADLEPDVDAIYRLTIGKPIQFSKRSPIYVAPGSYCPFNSQNTLWYPEAFQYLFLPSFIPSRVTDIWRGYIAQRFLHLNQQGMIFLSPSVYQERNWHNLLHDFIEEIALYAKTEDLVTALDRYDNSFAEVMKYLFQQEFFKAEEVELFAAWLNDLRVLGYANLP